MMSFLLVGFWACDKENDKELTELLLSHDRLELSEGESATVEIKSGNGRYTINIGDKEVATASLIGSNVKIQAQHAGKTEVTVQDSDEQTVVIAVSVNARKTPPAELQLESQKLVLMAKELQGIAITSGNGEYDASSNDNNIATVAIADSQVLISGQQEGSAVITVQDVKSGSTLTVEVTVQAQPVVRLERKSLGLQENKDGKVKISGGLGPYEASSSQEEFATAEVKDGQLIIHAHKEGKSTITVDDTKTGLSAKLDVTVYGQAVVSLERTSLWLTIGDREEVSITDGEGPYEVKSGNTDAAIATLKDGKVVIEAKKEGDATIAVSDKTTGLKAELTVHVKTTTPALALSKASVQMTVGKTEKVTISAGSGTYEVKSLDQNVASVVENGGTISITGKKKGSTSVSVQDVETKDKKSIEVTVDAIAPVTVDLPNITVEVGKTQTVTISGGSGNYSVSVPNAAQASYVSINHTGSSIAITGNTKDKTVLLKVSDTETGDFCNVSVQVVPVAKEIMLSKSTVNVVVGETAEVQITQWNGWKSDPQPADGKVTAAFYFGSTPPSIRITGVSAGSSSVTIEDAAGKTKTISVTIEEPREIELSAATLSLKQDETKTVIISQWNGFKDGGITATAGKWNIAHSFDEPSQTLTITGKKVGETILSIEDAAGKTATLTISVTPVDLALATNVLTLHYGETQKVAIQSWNRGKFSNNLKLDDANCKAEMDWSNSMLPSINITGLVVGSSAVHVSDFAGKTGTINVTIEQVQIATMPTTTTTSTPIEVQVDETKEVRITRWNGKTTGDITKGDDNIDIATSYPNDEYFPTIAITGKSEGSSTVNITDAAGATHSINVTVTAQSGGSTLPGPAVGTPHPKLKANSDGTIVPKVDFDMITDANVVLPEGGRKLTYDWYQTEVTDIITVDCNRVEEIGNGVFELMTGLTTVTMRMVYTVGFRAFMGDTSLQTIECYMPGDYLSGKGAAASFDANAFHNVGHKVTIRIPQGATAAYQEWLKDVLSDVNIEERP